MMALRSYGSCFDPEKRCTCEPGNLPGHCEGMDDGSLQKQMVIIVPADVFSGSDLTMIAMNVNRCCWFFCTDRKYYLIVSYY